MAADSLPNDAVPRGARDASIDVLRGLAIVTMIAANMAPYVLAEPHPLPFRIYGSFAAPTFVFLAGLMIGRARQIPAMSRTLKRSAGLLAVASGIDVLCWDVAPFSSFDVLYLIGFSLPIAALCLALDVRFHALLGLGVLASTPLLRHVLGYGPLLPEGEPWPLWRRPLVDGWFPVFPWLGVALLGAAAGRVRAVITPRAQVLTGVALTALGLLALFVKPPALVTRAGYSELFYPPTVPYLCAAIGTLILLDALVPHVRKRVPLGWLETFGRASLLVYVAHTLLIVFVFKELFGPQPLSRFLGLYAGHAALLWVIARARVELRRRQAAT